MQHTLRHLSRLSNTELTEDACACLATGELPPGMAGPASPEEQKQLTEEEHAELASQSQELALKLPKINLGIPKRIYPRGGVDLISHIHALYPNAPVQHWHNIVLM